MRSLAVDPVLVLSCLVAATPGALRGQVPTDTIVVVSAMPGPARSQLTAVSATGSSSPLGRFPSDTLLPLAVEVDPIDRHVLVAVDLGTGVSRLLRLLPGPTLGEVVLADVPGLCAQLVATGDHLLAVTGGSNGGVWRLPRRGGTAVQTVARPFASALLPFASSDVAILAWSGNTVPASAPGLAYVDTATGQIQFGPFDFANLVGAEPTGLIDLPTALSRQLIGFAGGGFAMHVAGLGAPTVMPMTPPPLACTAFKPDDFGFSGIGLGDAAAPILYRADTAGTVTVLVAGLPGAPVDFAPPLRGYPQVIPFGDGCGGPALQLVNGVMGPPQVGNLSFDVRVGNAQPNQPVFFLAGFDDILGGALPVPVFGCPLHVVPDTIDFLLTNGGGLGIKSLPVPPLPVLAGVILFGQWAQFAPVGGVVASPAIAIQVGL